MTVIGTNDRVRASWLRRVDWNLVFGFSMYTAAFVILLLAPKIVDYSAFIRDGRLIPEGASFIVAYPLFIVFLMPPLLGPIAFICWRDELREIRVGLALFLVAAMFAMGLEEGFWSGQWVYLDLIFIMHLLALGSRCPETQSQLVDVRVLRMRDELGSPRTQVLSYRSDGLLLLSWLASHNGQTPVQGQRVHSSWRLSRRMIPRLVVTHGKRLQIDDGAE